MYSCRHRVLSWAIIVWFAILQIMLPFIHAHVVNDPKSEFYGIHLHEDSAYGLNQLNYDLPGLTNPTDNAQIVSVEKGINNHNSLKVFATVCLFSILVYSFFKQIRTVYFTQTQLRRPRRRWRSRLQSRAPPTL